MGAVSYQKYTLGGDRVFHTPFDAIAPDKIPRLRCATPRHSAAEPADPSDQRRPRPFATPTPCAYDLPAHRTASRGRVAEDSLRLSKRTEYGVRAVVQLARLWPQGFVQAKDLSRQERMPNKFLEAILAALVRGGFLESKIGRDGGYRLSRGPADIRVGDVIRRLEGRLSAKEGETTNDRSPGEVAVHLLNEKLTEATEGALDDLTLEQLLEHVNRSGSLQQMYYI